MSPSGNVRSLIDFAESIELYAHRNRIIVRLELDDYEAARNLCRRAVAQCSEITESMVTGPCRAEHEKNGRLIRRLETMIAETQMCRKCEFRPPTAC